MIPIFKNQVKLLGPETVEGQSLTYHDSNERSTSRTWVPASNLLKGDGESKEQQVEQRVDERQVDRHAEDDGFPEHENKRSSQGDLERLRERNSVHLVCGSVGVRVVFLSQSRGLLLEQDRSVRLGREQGEEEDASEEDEEDPVDPPPVASTDIDPASEKRSETGAHANASVSLTPSRPSSQNLQDCKREDSHGDTSFAGIPNVGNGSSDVCHWCGGSGTSDLRGIDN